VISAYCRLDPDTLAQRASSAHALLSSCACCPRICGVDRTAGGRGCCGAGAFPFVSSYGPHFGEEPPLVGRRGSGTIFFAGCSLSCAFCQNYQISQERRGREVPVERLAEMMLELQSMGCHNINLVTPTHQVPQILDALAIAASRGLAIPLVYNSSGYEQPETLRLLDGIVDIYMPDAKYGSDAAGAALSGVPDYATVMKQALLEMQRQVGDLVCTNGIAERGLLIRHLVLPQDLAGTEEVMRFIAEEVSKDAYVNVMAQYRPAWRVAREPDDPRYAPLSRPITQAEHEAACRAARKHGLHRGSECLQGEKKADTCPRC
jgi:putative pyruvate formate lyase activating enzyme